MWKNFIQLIKVDRSSQVLLILTAVFFIWWFVLQGWFSENEFQRMFWAHSYQIVAVFDFIAGIHIAQEWGNFSSIMGKSIMAFTIGLLLHIIDKNIFQYAYWFDLNFFGTIPFYIYGIALLSKTTGAKFSLHAIKKHPYVLFLSILMIGVSYLFFLQNHQLYQANELHHFLYIVYVLEQIMYISIAMLTYFLSIKILGGIMRLRILFLLIGFPIVQYIADYNFLYQQYTGTWIPGGYGDLIYLLSYFFIVFGLMQFQAKYFDYNTL